MKRISVVAVVRLFCDGFCENGPGDYVFICENVFGCDVLVGCCVHFCPCFDEILGQHINYHEIYWDTIPTLTL